MTTETKWTSEENFARPFEMKFPFPEELLLRPDMLVGSRVVSIRPNGEYEMGAGFPLPAVAIEVPIAEIQKLNEAATKIAALEIRLKQGFYNLFRNDTPTARELLKLVFPPTDVYDDYIQLLSDLFEKNPEMCLLTAHSYRGDGRLKPDGGIAFNEVNAFPGGIHWVSELAKYLKQEHAVETYGLKDLEECIASEIQAELPKTSGGIFFPTVDLSGYKVIEETLAMARILEERGFMCVIGEPNSLKTNGKIIYVTFKGKEIPISYIDGVSSPTTFARYPEVLEAVSRGVVTCPAISATTLSITNKGMFCLITSMVNGSIDPKWLQIDEQELKSLAEPVPETYWVATHNGPLEGEWVLKPFDGAGGSGVIVNPNKDEWRQIEPHYLAQRKLEEFSATTSGTIHKGSLDPYLIRRENCLQTHGIISRGSLPGSLSNVSAHTGKENGTLSNHLGIVISQTL
jgi:hypothetical protein